MRSVRRYTGPVLLGVMLLGCVPQTMRQGASGVGELAPPIEGAGVNGLAMRLSDHHGKVVLLSFWHSN